MLSPEHLESLERGWDAGGPTAIARDDRRGGRPSQELHPLNQERPSTSPSPQGWGRDGFYSWGGGSCFPKPVSQLSTQGLCQAQGVNQGGGCGVGGQSERAGLKTKCPLELLPCVTHS